KSSFGAVIESSSNPAYWTCQDTPYTTVETDKLRGTPLSFIHPMDLNQVTFNYDYHSDQTYAIAGNPATPGGLPPAVPNTMEKYNTLSLTGDIALNERLTLKVGAYQNWLYLIGWARAVFSSNKCTIVTFT